MLDNAALYGLAGEVVDRLAPQTESDPAALLLTVPHQLRQRHRTRTLL